MFNQPPINRETIIKVPNPILKFISKDVPFPLSKPKQDLIKQMHQYLVESNNPEIAVKKNLEPGVGLAAPQVGKNLNICLVYIEDENNQPYFDQIFINPSIIKHSKQKIYLESGEGCLSIPDKVDGYVHRWQTIVVEYLNIDGEPQQLIAEDFIAIAIQHEIDHLNGILYTDYLDPQNPFKLQKNSSPL